jgi:hypothetical protein
MFGVATAAAEEQESKQRAHHVFNLHEPEAPPILKPG